MTADHVYSVTDLTRRIKSVLESGVGPVWLEGELSNVSRPSSGHCYFTIKDEAAQISAVLFRGARRQARCEPVDGLRVRCQGDITVYERQGRYQILVRTLEEAGQGALQARFEALKKKLAAEGLFESSRKRPLPLLPLRLGIVTSPTGAALRDILNVVGRRFPNLHIVLAPVMVQGEGAAAAIAKAIDRLNALPSGLDALIVGRGGGSLEDLQAFNEEIVARAVARSRIPVISAVGHEIDFTISDFVADVRAPTPSAAAELVIGRKEDFEALLQEMNRRLVFACQAWADQVRHRFTRARDSYVFREPAHGVRQAAQRLDTLDMRMRHALLERHQRAARALEAKVGRLEHPLQRQRDLSRERIRRLADHLRALSPLAVLNRGYSLTTDDAGLIVKDAAGLRPEDSVHVRLAKGVFAATVRTVEAKQTKT